MTITNQIYANTPIIQLFRRPLIQKFAKERFFATSLVQDEGSVRLKIYAHFGKCLDAYDSSKLIN